MGKSTTAQMFREAGIPVWDADTAVHRLYAKGGAAVEPLATLYPQAVQGGEVDRAVLKSEIANDPLALTRIEAVVHPLVAEDRAAFLRDTQADIVVLDIPLLFENGTESEMDATLLVTAPPEIQRARVLARAGMTKEHLERILARQMPDPKKRALATHVVETLSLDSTRAFVHALIAHIRQVHLA